MYYYVYVGPPSSVSSITIGETCLKTSTIVSWSPSSSNSVCGPVSYNVTISPSDGVMMMMNITSTFYNFTELTPGNNYTVTVAGINLAGVGESNTATFHIPTIAEAIPSGKLTFYSYNI